MPPLLPRILPKRFLGSEAFASVARRVYPRADLGLRRLTGGRLSLTAVTGLPFLLLETTGRRTGQPRVTPLTYASERGGAYLVAGSNWGQERQPGWVLNLLAKPEAVVTARGSRVPVTATVLSGEERTAAWSLLLEVWPAYDEYAKRVSATSGREIRVFRLERS
jgi:deazaflavin-dependent oxidoreductase (nitroreductase family)